MIYIDGLSENIHGNPLQQQKDKLLRAKAKMKGYEIIEALLDDLNTPKVIAQINKITNQEQIPEKTLQIIKYIDEKILKLDLFKPLPEEEISIPEDIKQLAEKRWEAKKQKTFF